jgi:transposase
MRNVALDVGKGKYVMYEVRGDKVVARATAKSHLELEKLLGKGTPPARVAFEACREGWWLHRKLQQWGHEPVMLDSTRIRQLGVGHHRRKNDPIDAEVIARALERGYVTVAHVLSEGRREIRYQLAIRGTLIDTRTTFINVVRGLAVSEGVQLPSCAAENFVRHVRAAVWPATIAGQIEPLLASLEQVATAIDQATALLHSLSEKDPTISRLATVPYVGLITAATFVSVIDDAGRFDDGHKVASYLGLVPIEDTSNSAPRLGSITKAGNRWARVVLVQSAWLMLTKGDPSDSLVAWGRDVLEKRNKFIAAVALARKLAGVLWAIWKNQTVYKPRPLANRNKKAGDATSAEKAIAAARAKLRPKIRRVRKSAAATTAHAEQVASNNATSVTKRSGRSSSRGGESIANI